MIAMQVGDYHRDLGGGPQRRQIPISFESGFTAIDDVEPVIDRKKSVRVFHDRIERGAGYRQR